MPTRTTPASAGHIFQLIRAGLATTRRPGCRVVGAATTVLDEILSAEAVDGALDTGAAPGTYCTR